MCVKNQNCTCSCCPPLNRRLPPAPPSRFSYQPPHPPILLKCASSSASPAKTSKKSSSCPTAAQPRRSCSWPQVRARKDASRRASPLIHRSLPAECFSEQASSITLFQGALTASATASVAPAAAARALSHWHAGFPPYSAITDDNLRSGICIDVQTAAAATSAVELLLPAASARALADATSALPSPFPADAHGLAAAAAADAANADAAADADIAMTRHVVAADNSCLYSSIQVPPP
jgi:hypothetical protein